jgi:hypothetical protein
LATTHSIVGSNLSQSSASSTAWVCVTELDGAVLGGQQVCQDELCAVADSKVRRKYVTRLPLSDDVGARRRGRSANG